MAHSNIEWTELTWNPVTGCNKVSAGCKFCYAEVMSRRLMSMGMKKYRNGFRLTLHPHELDSPFAWKKSKIVFVNSMSDLFHKDIPLSYIKKVFEVMNQTPQHTYQILTKRPELVLKYNSSLNWTPNIWMGTSVEDSRVVERIDFLRKSNAQVKFLSLEPLIGPLPNLNLQNIHWVIVGGESGNGARPMEFKWAWDIKQQCKKSDTLFFFKQWGKREFNIDPEDPTIDVEHKQHAKGGCQLKGRIYRQMPERSTQLMLNVV
jgi:protein gp37